MSQSSASLTLSSSLAPRIAFSELVVLVSAAFFSLPCSSCYIGFGALLLHCTTPLSGMADDYGCPCFETHVCSPSHGCFQDAVYILIELTRLNPTAWIVLNADKTKDMLFSNTASKPQNLPSILSSQGLQISWYIN